MPQAQYSSPPLFSMLEESASGFSLVGTETLHQLVGSQSRAGLPFLFPFLFSDRTFSIPSHLISPHLILSLSISSHIISFYLGSSKAHCIWSHDLSSQAQ